ncbi:MAG: hypothetical protein ACO3FT_04900 [Ilumatobacteraceae bacterium]|jgi:hypothetical protein
MMTKWQKIPVTLTPAAIDALTLLIHLGMDRLAPVCDAAADTDVDDAYAQVVEAVQEWNASIAQHAAMAPDTPHWTGPVHDVLGMMDEFEREELSS